MKKNIHHIYHLFEVLLIETNLFPIKQARRKHSEEVNAACHLLANPRELVQNRCPRLPLSFQPQGLEVLLALCYQEIQ